jgi:hypothetical protein
VIPSDGECTHRRHPALGLSRLRYQGFLSGGSFHVASGESHVTATAYPQPCSAEPSAPPWIADEQIVTFDAGPNTLTLAFHANTTVAIDPTFDDDTTLVVVRAGSAVRTSRNGEGASSPNYALDGWEVKTVGLPPAAPTETVLFSMEGKGGIPYAARHPGTFDGFIAWSPDVPAAVAVRRRGNFVETEPVVYPTGTVR